MTHRIAGCILFPLALLMAGCSVSSFSDAGHETYQPDAATQVLPAVGGYTATASLSPTPSPYPSHTPRPTATITSTPLPTQSILSYKDKWVTFFDEKSGVTFEYPAVFQHPDYLWCGPSVYYRNGKTIIYFLANYTWIIEDSASKTTQQALDELQQDDESDDLFFIESIDQGEIFNTPGYVVSYRFGSSNRYGSAMIVQIGDKLVLGDFNAGLFCDIPEINFYAQEAMLRFDQTFRFVEDE